jgi:hypothetical protein
MKRPFRIPDSLPPAAFRASLPVRTAPGAERPGVGYAGIFANQGPRETSFANPVIINPAYACVAILER